ncbi:MAG: hypothetical protein SGJ02_02245 [bacterium]|nr:hypothetical protein [bacterium]
MARSDRHVAIFTAFEDMIPWDAANPERNLLRAMLITAMHDIRKKGKVQKLAFEYFQNLDETYPFSFLSICNYLGVDSNSVLESIGLLSRDIKSEISKVSISEFDSLN